jgi:prophage antirepressor-like protein
VRTVEKDGAPWFLAKDVCAALEVGNVSMAVEKLDADERDVISSTDSVGRRQEMLVISESGLYALVLRCRDAMTPGSVAHRFRKWVTAEVRPTIRATGGYGEACFDEARISRVAGEATAAAVKALVPVLEDERQGFLLGQAMKEGRFRFSRLVGRLGSAPLETNGRAFSMWSKCKEAL